MFPRREGISPLDYDTTVQLLREQFVGRWTTLNVYEGERGYPSIVMQGRLELEELHSHVNLQLWAEPPHCTPFGSVPTGTVLIHSAAFAGAYPPMTREANEVEVAHAGLRINVSAGGVSIDWDVPPAA